MSTDIVGRIAEWDHGVRFAPKNEGRCLNAPKQRNRIFQHYLTHSSDHGVANPRSEHQVAVPREAASGEVLRITVCWSQARTHKRLRENVG